MSPVIHEDHSRDPVPLTGAHAHVRQVAVSVDTSGGFIPDWRRQHNTAVTMALCIHTEAGELAAVTEITDEILEALNLARAERNRLNSDA